MRLKGLRLLSTSQLEEYASWQSSNPSSSRPSACHSYSSWESVVNWTYSLLFVVLCLPGPSFLCCNWIHSILLVLVFISLHIMWSADFAPALSVMECFALGELHVNRVMLKPRFKNGRKLNVCQTKSNDRKVNQTIELYAQWLLLTIYTAFN
jgi:hypothetical protein